jgi:predicted nuclease of predicted toxin-antitoxin system
MPSDRPRIRCLLDKHYPGWLAEALAAEGIDAVALTAHRPELGGVDDRTVLEAAVAERQVVVTEDVSTFTVATGQTGPHVGVVYCHHARFPRTRPGLDRLRSALSGPAKQPPGGSANTQSSGGLGRGAPFIAPSEKRHQVLRKASPVTSMIAVLQPDSL